MRSHGTRAKYVIDQCRCALCTTANTREAARLELRKLSGELIWHDAGPVRAHVRILLSAGIGWKRVAVLAGVSNGCMSKILYGSRTRPAPSRVRYATARKILAVRPDPAAARFGAVIDATGTIRRLQALVAVGWNLSELGRRLDMERTNIGTLIARPRVIARTARAVADLYSQLWDAAPPSGTPTERASITIAKQMATARRWAPPMAWDDETIDLPAARPAGVTS